ncbi:MAG: zinc carboxypeptidase, partial [Melioribacteraceae bacterium]|nr:zinc carboxypeptidase [Melioribacteraceae bacterium]
LDEMYTAYPSLITQRDSIGSSIENRSIYMVKISDNPTTKEEEPEVLYTALHHAREPESMMQMIYFMFYLLENYGIDDEVTYLVDNREIYFIPVVNPDGYRYNETIAPNGGGMWRKNRRTNDDGSRGVDLNRNYGYKWNYDNQGSSGNPSNDLYRGTAPFSEPETETIRQFCISHNFKLALNYHTYGNLLITPWGYIPEETPDSILFREYASDMTIFNGYTWGTSEDILYGVNGDADDWFYGEQTEKNKILAMTPEVGDRTDYFWPPQSRIIPLAEENVYPNLYIAWVAGGYVNSTENNFNTEYYFANQTGTISSAFKNKGLSNIENVTAILSSDNEFVQVTNSTNNIGDFESRAEKYFEHAFEFVIAENPPLGEKLYLTLNTFQNGILMSEVKISLIVGYPLVFLEDNADSLGTNWAAESNVDKKWETTEYSFFTTPKSFTDSRIGDYLSNTESSLTLTEPIDLSQVENPYLSFMT